jgi:predicted transcriptional regulator
MKLNGKVLLKVASLRNKFRMSLEGRLIYSWLVYRLRFGKGSNKLQLARCLNLDRTKTVPAGLKRLVDLGIVECREGRYFAREAPAEHFSYRAGDGPWYERLNYWYFPLPTRACPLTTRQIAVWSQLQCPNFQPTVAAVASRLCIDRKTVRTALAKLSGFGLVTPKFGFQSPSAGQLAWFRDKPSGERGAAPVNWERYHEHYASWVAILAQEYPHHDWAGTFLTIGRLAKRAGYSSTRLRALLSFACIHKDMPVAARVLLQFPALIGKAEEKYDRKQFATSMGLLHKLVKDYVRVAMRSTGE